ncbi:MAG TPA: hypothetical protein VN515_01205 [Terriglobales bacterium]|nr:hypothetical protein [Terriglobales bacterium]
MSSDRRTLVYVLLIFVSGALVGGTLMNMAEHYLLHAHPANEYDIRQHRLIAQQMSQRLHLDPMQQKQVDTVLQETLGQYQDLELHLAPQFDQLRQRDRDHLRAILNPRQRVEFDKIVAEVDEKYPLNERPAVLSPVPCESTATAHP